MKLGIESHMSPQRERAWATVEALKVKWHVPAEAVSATVAALEELEHLRPVVECAKAIVDATSGEQRGVAVVATIAAVEALRGSGR